LLAVFICGIKAFLKSEFKLIELDEQETSFGTLNLVRDEEESREKSVFAVLGIKKKIEKIFVE